MWLGNKKVYNLQLLDIKFRKMFGTFILFVRNLIFSFPLRVGARLLLPSSQMLRPKTARIKMVFLCIQNHWDRLLQCDNNNLTCPTLFYIPLPHVAFPVIAFLSWFPPWKLKSLNSRFKNILKNFINPRRKLLFKINFYNQATNLMYVGHSSTRTLLLLIVIKIPSTLSILIPF